MPFWKSEKKTIGSKREMRCPDCLSTNLRYASRTGIVLGQPRLICPDCGYRGVVYVDINPTDEHEDELDAEFLKENPEFLESRRSKEELAKECLQDKWIPDQSLNTHTLRDWCPFCADVHVVCSICQCPSEICRNQATEGYIGELNALFDDETPLCDVDSNLYKKIVSAFQKITLN